MTNTATASSSKSGIGVGSASIILIFAVLCLTIFTLITYIVAGNNKALIDAEHELVLGYYTADSLAEQVLAELQDVEEIPEMLYGVEINTEYDSDRDTKTVSYSCPVSDIKELYVKVVFYNDTFDILSWRMTDTDQWQADDGINIWTGE